MRRRILALNIGALAALVSIPAVAQESSRFTLEEVVVFNTGSLDKYLPDLQHLL
jgi:hypothetical protein